MSNLILGILYNSNNFMIYMLLTSILMFLMAFISKRKHLLATLLSLEGLMLMLFSFIYYLSAYLVSLQSFLLVFLTLAACEGALGLSLLVLMVRSYGGDQFQSFSFLQC